MFDFLFPFPFSRIPFHYLINSFLSFSFPLFLIHLLVCFSPAFVKRSKIPEFWFLKSFTSPVFFLVVG